MTEMFGEAWSPMSVPDLAPDDDDDCNCPLLLSMFIDMCEVKISTFKLNSNLHDDYNGILKGESYSSV